MSCSCTVSSVKKISTGVKLLLACSLYCHSVAPKHEATIVPAANLIGLLQCVNSFFRGFVFVLAVFLDAPSCTSTSVDCTIQTGNRGDGAGGRSPVRQEVAVRLDGMQEDGL